MLLANKYIFGLFFIFVSPAAAEIYGAWPYDPYGPDFYEKYQYPYPNYPYNNNLAPNRVVAGQITGAEGGAQIGSLVGGLLGLAG